MCRYVNNNVRQREPYQALKWVMSCLQLRIACVFMTGVILQIPLPTWPNTRSHTCSWLPYGLALTLIVAVQYTQPHKRCRTATKHASQHILPPLSLVQRPVPGWLSYPPHVLLGGVARLVVGKSQVTSQTTVSMLRNYLAHSTEELKWYNHHGRTRPEDYMIHRLRSRRPF